MAENDKSINQKQGVINRCPNCGGQLTAFVSHCEMCGHELTGIGANRTVADLVQKFAAVEAELAAAGITGGKLEKELVARKARIIRDFPIPNAREDLQSLIYYIHPKIQDNIKPDPNAEDWRVKFREVLNLAKNAYKGDAKTRAEFEEIERSLNVSLSGVLKTRAKRSPLIAAGVGVVAILVAVGVAGTQMDKWKLKQCQDKYAQGAVNEKARLEGIVTKAAAQQQERKYNDALASLNALRWEYQEACMTEAAAQEQAGWEEKRKELVALVGKAEEADQAQQREAAQQAADEKRAAEEREAAEKRAAAEHEQAEKLATHAKEMSASRKAAISKEW